MAIEFGCSQCSKLLSVPDGSEGRQAKCPSCGTICDVPSASAPQPPAEKPGLSGLGDGSLLSSPAENPYAAPQMDNDDLPVGPRIVEAAPLQHTLIDVGDLLTRSWDIYKAQMGMTIGLVMIVVAIPIGVNMGTSLISGIVSVAGSEELYFAVSLILGIAEWILKVWLGLGLARAMLDLMRGQQVEIGQVFSGGPYVGRAVLAGFLIGLAFMVGVLAFSGLPALIGYVATDDEAVTGIAALVGFAVFLIPLIYVSLAISQYQFFIVDRNAGAIESLKLSWEFTRGNKLSLFLLGIIAGAAVLAGTIACCVGLIFTLPYVYTISAVTFLAMTGQPTTNPMAIVPRP